MSKRLFRSLWILAGLVALLLLGATIGLIVRSRAQVSQGVTAHVTGSSSLFHLREQPDRTSRIVAMLERGTAVTVTNSVTENDQTWYWVETEDRSGWIQAQHVRLDAP